MELVNLKTGTDSYQVRAEKPELAMNTRGGCASLLITTH